MGEALNHRHHWVHTTIMYYSNSALRITLYVFFMPEVRPKTQFSPQLDNEIVFFQLTLFGARCLYMSVCGGANACAHLYRLWVIEMAAQVHQYLRHPVWDIIGARQDARTEAEHSSMAPH